MTGTATQARRLVLLRERMKADGIELVALGPGPHMDWLLGFHPHADERPSMLLVGPEKEAFLMPALNAEDAKRKTDIRLCEWSDAQGPHAALREALGIVSLAGTRSVAVDETMRTDFSLLLLDEIPDAKRSYVAQSLGKLRMRKDKAEQQELLENAVIADAAMEECFAALSVGKAEMEIAEVANKAFLSHGARPVFAIVAAGKNGAHPHHKTGDGRIENGDAVVIDIGGKKGAFSSDMTRMAIVGESPEDYRKVHDTVEQAVLAGMDAARPGVPAKNVDCAARSVIEKAGYGKYFVHRTGHGLGIEIHEPPFLTSTSETVLDEGMVFSIEPGIYLPGKFGVRLEEIVVLEKDGPRILSSLPRDARTVS